MNPFPHSKNVIDTQAALRRLGGDEKLLATMATFFLEDAPELLKQLNGALASRDLDTVMHRAHSLKGLSATFDALVFVEIAREVESLAKIKNDSPVIDRKVSELNDEFEKLISALRNLGQTTTAAH